MWQTQFLFVVVAQCHKQKFCLLQWLSVTNKSDFFPISLLHITNILEKNPKTNINPNLNFTSAIKLLWGTLTGHIEHTVNTLYTVHTVNTEHTLHTVHTIHTVYTVHTIYTVHTEHAIHTVYTVPTVQNVHTVKTGHTEHSVQEDWMPLCSAFLCLLILNCQVPS